VPRGYQASQTLGVKVHDTGKVGDILTVATTQGANQIGGVSFTIDNPEAVRSAARAKAIDQAQQKAKELAGQLGSSLGRIAGFSEGGGYNYPPIMYAGAMMKTADAAETLPVPTGDQDVDVTVTLTYELL
jgi:uncharacterized protein YggE